MDHDMTTGREWKSILFFALPLMGSGLLQTMYSFADSVIVGNFVGETAFGAIGLLASLIMLVNMFCTSLGNGVSIVVSQFYGAGRKEDVRETADSALMLSGMVAVVVTLCLLLSRPVISGFLRTPEDMLGYSLQYFRVYAIGLLFQFVYQVAYGILRAHGDSRGAMFFLLVSAVLNVGLDLLFVIVFHWEVLGAVSATVISQAGAAAACLAYLHRHYPHLSPLNPANRIFRPEKIRLIRKISIPILCQSSVLCIGFIVLQRLVNSFGAASIEGYAAMQKVESFIHIIPGTLNSAMASFTGQNMGAGKPDRVRRGFRSTALMALGVSAVIAAVMIAFDRPFLSVFGISEEGLKRGCEHLDLLVIFMLANSVYTVAAGLLQGAGDVKITALASFVNLFIRVGSAYLMAGTSISYRCIWLSLPPAWTTNLLINLARYLSGAWTKKTLVTKA